MFGFGLWADGFGLCLDFGCLRAFGIQGSEAHTRLQRVQGFKFTLWLRATKK